MKSNYDLLGNHIRLIDNRNKDLVTEQVLGINIDKFFMPSVANVIGTDLSKYKLIQKGNFACNPMHVGRDERLPVALYSEDTPAIVSPAYFMFEIKDATVLNADFLMMWFRRPEFDRICWLHTDGSVRGGITWDDICRMEIPVPPIDKQIEIVNSYQAITERIKLKKQINDNLYAQAKAIFDNHFINIDAIPAGWRKGNLLDIANYLNGLAMQKFRPQGHEIGLPVLKIKELRQGSCDDSSELCSLSIKPEYIIHNGDVVFSWSGSLLVDIWCGGTCGLNQHLFKVTSDVYDKWFYYLWTAHHLARFIAIAADKATTMGHIKREELAKAEVLIPCEEDYTSFNSIMQPIFELIISNRIESRKLAALRDELLPKLMTGEIDISDVQL